jgi:hypothetical protein
LAAVERFKIAPARFIDKMGFAELKLNGYVNGLGSSCENAQLLLLDPTDADNLVTEVAAALEHGNTAVYDDRNRGQR